MGELKIGFLLTVLGATQMNFAQMTQPTQGSAPSFSIAIHAKLDVVKSGAPVLVDVLKTNISDQEIKYSTPKDSREEWENYTIEVKDEQGKSVPETEILRESKSPVRDEPGHLSPRHIRDINLWTLKPHETFHDLITVSVPYDMTWPGKYTIRLSQTDHARKVVVRSNSITVTVKDAAQSLGDTYGTQTPFALVISAWPGVVKLGSDINIDIYLLNNSHDEIQVNPVVTSYAIEVRYGDGSVALLTERGREFRKQFGRGGTPRIGAAPGELAAAGGIRAVNTLYDMTRPGTYTIQVSRVDEASKVVVKSNILTLTVTP